jgi:DNA-binding LacI/PurR family transcriptional regulator
MTVSRELRNARHVSSGKRERVLAAPSALD